MHTAGACNFEYSSAINVDMDNLLSSGISSVFPASLKMGRALLMPHSQRNLSAKSTTHLLLLSVALLLAFTVTHSAAQRPSSSTNPYNKYLATCSSDSDCDSSKTFLRCDGRVCKCSAIYHYDEDYHRCLIRVGGSCTPGSNPKQHCVAYAVCEASGKGNNANGVCKCRSRYKDNIDNLCVSGASRISYNFPHFWFSLPVAVLLIQFVGQR